MSLLAAMRKLFHQQLLELRTWYRRRNALGPRGERFAASYLRWKKGMYIIEASARNIYGEIDIIAADRKKERVIFIEVKTRTSHDRGHPAEAVTSEKQRKISKIALAYMKRNALLDSCSVRFDVIAITWTPDQKPMLEHYENAFEAVGV